MKNIVLHLNPATREELYSDIHPDFLAFVLMEAVCNVVGNIPVALEMHAVVDDTTEYLDDPDCNLAASCEYLKEVMVRWDAGDGVQVTSPGYDINAYMTEISVKLATAVESIAQFNDPLVLASLGEFFMTPGVKEKVNFSTFHLGNVVMFMIAENPLLMKL